jgi:proteasome assembly chaperone (PAC2) family protein
MGGTTNDSVERSFSVIVHRVPGTSTVGYILNERVIEDINTQKTEEVASKTQKV